MTVILMYQSHLWIRGLSITPINRYHYLPALVNLSTAQPSLCV